MEQQAFVSLCSDCFFILKRTAPVDTGNLKNNAVRIAWKNMHTAIIYVDDSVAPYMPYTNEPWVAARWKGKRNPNQYWFDRAARMSYGRVRHITGVEGVRTDNPKKLNIPRLAKEYRVDEKNVYINSTYQVNEYGLREYWNLQRGNTP